jgi:hypothetical protein
MFELSALSLLAKPSNSRAAAFLPLVKLKLQQAEFITAY